MEILVTAKILAGIKAFFIQNIRVVYSHTILYNNYEQTLNFPALPGDGIGPEVMDIALDILQATGEIYDFKIEYETKDVGGIVR